MTPRPLFVFIALLVGAAQAQTPNYEAMNQAMEKAQAEASKPGDDQLDCAQLEAQLMAVTQDPQFRSYYEAAGAKARKEQAAMEAAKGQVALQSFRTVMMATVPGAAFPGMASAQAQAQAQGAAGMKDMTARARQTEKMIALLPTIMRGQRVIELAIAKKCAWAEEADMSK